VGWRVLAVWYCKEVSLKGVTFCEIEVLKAPLLKSQFGLEDEGTTKCWEVFTH